MVAIPKRRKKNNKERKRKKSNEGKRKKSWEGTEKERRRKDTKKEKWKLVCSSYPKEAKQLLMAADLSHLLSVDKIKHKYEKTVKDICSHMLVLDKTCE